MDLNRILLIGVLALGMTACQQNIKPSGPYPSEVFGVVDPLNYPPNGAGFVRGSVIAYAPNQLDTSVAYNLYSERLQIAATIYRTSKRLYNIDFDKQWENEKDVITKSHPGAIYLSENAVSFSKDGHIYNGKIASFRFDGNFMQRRQSLYSEIILLDVDDLFVKLRGTSPIGQKQNTLGKCVELMDVVNWKAQP